MVIGAALPLDFGLRGQVVARRARPEASAAIDGAAGDGVSDDTDAIQRAIDALPVGGALDFGDAGRTYLIHRPLRLKPDAAYSGAATIRMSTSAPGGTQIAILHYRKADNVSIDGLTLDANGVGGGISIDINGGASIPAHNIAIRHVTFLNTNPRPVGGGDNAIYDPVGISGADITANRFVNCGGGILLSDPGDVRITDNEFDDILHDDAIYLLFPQNPFPYGTGIEVSGNHGRRIMRIAIEMWGPGGSAVQAPVIANNSFRGWSSESYGISIMAGTQAQIVSNVLSAGSGPFGIELGAPDSTVRGNTVEGFVTGIVAHDAHDSVIDSNTLTAQSATGITLSNAPGTRSNLQITNNNIDNPQFNGLLTQDNKWENTVISGNTISRHLGGWSGDNIYTEFQAFAFYPPEGPVSVTRNSIVEDGVPIPGFRFVGLGVNGDEGANSGSVYDSNTITSNLPQPAGIGIFINVQGGLDHVTVTNNTFQNLAIVTSGQPSPAVVYRNNVVINCEQLGVTDLVN